MQLNLKADLCTVRAGAGQGGTIRPAGQVGITCGDSKTFTITPDDGYIVADVLVDDVSVGAKEVLHLCLGHRGSRPCGAIRTCSVLLTYLPRSRHDRFASQGIITLWGPV